MWMMNSWAAHVARRRSGNVAVDSRGDAVPKVSERFDESLDELSVGVQLGDPWERVDEHLDKELLPVACHFPVVALGGELDQR